MTLIELIAWVAFLWWALGSMPDGSNFLTDMARSVMRKLFGTPATERPCVGTHGKEPGYALQELPPLPPGTKLFGLPAIAVDGPDEVRSIVSLREDYHAWRTDPSAFWRRPDRDLWPGFLAAIPEDAPLLHAPKPVALVCLRAPDLVRVTLLYDGRKTNRFMTVRAYKDALAGYDGLIDTGRAQIADLLRSD